VTPPLEIIDRGSEAVISYMKELQKGGQESCTVPILFVGVGEAGKTSTIQALLSRENCGALHFFETLYIEHTVVALSVGR